MPCGKSGGREREREHFVAINGSIVNAFVLLLVVEVIGTGCYRRADGCNPLSLSLVIHDSFVGAERRTFKRTLNKDAQHGVTRYRHASPVLLSGILYYNHPQVAQDCQFCRYPEVRSVVE